MKLAYKGFGPNLDCKKEIFNIGQVYAKVFPEDRKPKLCSNEGYHYGTELRNVFTYYPNNGINRYCEIEVLGPYSEDSEKGITVAFRIIRELTKEELSTLLLDEIFNIDFLKNFQIKYPLSQVGGSVGLYLQGFTLKRWLEGSRSDYDIIIPYFISFHNEKIETKDGLVELNEVGDKGSSNDFDITVISENSIKIDIAINSKQAYETVLYKGFPFKVSKAWTILEYKFKYACQPSGTKHKQDLLELMSKNKVDINTDAVSVDGLDFF